METTSSSSDSDHNDHDPAKLMESKNPLIRLRSYGKLKKMMYQFKDGQPITKFESKIMRGMFKRKNKDFSEFI